MISIKTDQEIWTMREGGRLLALLMNELRQMVEPGISTKDLEDHFNKRLGQLDCRSAFLGYKNQEGVMPFPASLCTCLNDEVVHAPAVPARVLKNGDILSIDSGLIFPRDNGMFLDMAVTVPVGDIDARKRTLIDITRQACESSIAQLTPGMSVRDIGRLVQTIVEKHGFSIVRDFVRHGIGKKLHEEPQIPNFVDRRFPNYTLRPGMCLAIEPMVAVGRGDVDILSDGWTAVTADGSLSAHWEHTVVVTKDGVEILTMA